MRITSGLKTPCSGPAHAEALHREGLSASFVPVVGCEGVSSSLQMVRTAMRPLRCHFGEISGKDAGQNFQTEWPKGSLRLRTESGLRPSAWPCALQSGHGDTSVEFLWRC